MNQQIIVAHRGLSARFPENTLIALEQAIHHGAQAVEFDIQLTSDLVPILFHDTDLNRICGQRGDVRNKNWSQLQTYSAYLPDKFGDLHLGTPIASLRDAVASLAQHPGILACIEIKTESAEHFGVEPVVDAIVQEINAIRDRVQFLSFNADVIRYLHRLGIKETNWVLREVNAPTRREAEALQPSVLACRIDRRPSPFWPGPWDWMVYETQDPEQATSLFNEGARYVETDDVLALKRAIPTWFADT